MIPRRDVLTVGDLKARLSIFPDDMLVVCSDENVSNAPLVDVEGRAPYITGYVEEVCSLWFRDERIRGME